MDPATLLSHRRSQVCCTAPCSFVSLANKRWPWICSLPIPKFFVHGDLQASFDSIYFIWVDGQLWCYLDDALGGHMRLNLLPVSFVPVSSTLVVVINEWVLLNLPHEVLRDLTQIKCSISSAWKQWDRETHMRNNMIMCKLVNYNNNDFSFGEERKKKKGLTEKTPRWIGCSPPWTTLHDA